MRNLDFNSTIQKLQTLDVSDYDFYNNNRNFLGDLLKFFSADAKIFKEVHRNPNANNIQEAKNILIDIDNGNYNRLYEAIDKLHKEYQKLKIFNPSAKNIINTLHKTKFSSSNIEDLREAANQDLGTISKSIYYEEADKEGLDKHLDTSIYNVANQGEKTLKVIREILQNAADAVDTNQHPSLPTRASYSPDIKVTTNSYTNSLGEKKLDLIVEDQGIGMDWDTLSQKFFVTFKSGKETATGAAGGFGIAKRLIQNAPEDHWGIETNGIHSSRFHKDVYFGTKIGKSYSYPQSEIKEKASGTTLSLFGLPFVEMYYLRGLMEKYGVSGKINIIFNGTLVTPRFVMGQSDMKSLGATENLVDVLAKNDLEKNITKSILTKYKSGIDSAIDRAADSVNSKETQIEFFARPLASKYDDGKLFVMVNGQYQFEKTVYLDKIDVICSIKTTLRPNTEDYPLDPGRAYVRDPLGSQINNVVNRIKEFLQKQGENELLKMGIDAIMINSDLKPMQTFDPNIQSQVDRMVDSLGSNLSNLVNKPISDEEKKEELKNTLDQIRDNLLEKTDDIEPQTEIKPKTDIAEELGDKVIDSLVNDLVANQKKITVDDIKRVLSTITTPATVLIQKNFIAKEWLNKNIEITSELIIVWQRTLDIILKKLASTRTYSSIIKNKKFVPGLIYSDECLGLYMPEASDFGRPYPSVSVNPISMAASVDPDMFKQKIAGVAQKMESKQELDDKQSGDTPINRLTKLCYYIGTHELCHLLFPDQHGEKEFHENISHIMMIAHTCIEDIREEVKRFMPEIRRKVKILINACVKHGKINESILKIKFHEYILNKTNINEEKKYTTQKTHFGSFKEWFNNL